MRNLLYIIAVLEMKEHWNAINGTLQQQYAALTDEILPTRMARRMNYWVASS